jgi:hypothetical protein
MNKRHKSSRRLEKFALFASIIREPKSTWITLVGYSDSMGVIRDANIISMGRTEGRNVLEELSADCKIILK